MRWTPRVAAATLAVPVAFTLATTQAANPPRHDLFPLHPGSSGTRVAALQWLVSGHRPNVYTKVKPTLKHYTPGIYGARTKAAVLAYKFRLGYPRKGECGAATTFLTPTVTRWFFDLLQAKHHVVRSLCWIGLAAERIKGTVVPGVTKAALRIKALELSQLGVREIPTGSNRGPCISFTCTISGKRYGPYQGSTGAFGLAWCASFADWALKSVTGQGFGSANDAYVPTIVEHAQANGWIQAKPRVGMHVVFLNANGQLASAYHIGFIVKLVGGSGIETVEGNYDDGNHEVYRPFAAFHMVYVAKPGVA